jgi:hypothetical protein
MGKIEDKPTVRCIAVCFSNFTIAGPEAWGYVVRAFSLWERIAKENSAKARELVGHALKLIPIMCLPW